MTSLPLADRYARFRAAVFGADGVRETLPGFDQPVTEMELQSLWFAGAFRQRAKRGEQRGEIFFAQAHVAALPLAIADRVPGGGDGDEVVATSASYLAELDLVGVPAEVSV